MTIGQDATAESEHPRIPSRHGSDVANARAAAAGLRWLIRGNPEPARGQWRDLGEAYMHGDPAADRLVRWMRGHGMRAANDLFDRALVRGIENVPQAPAPLRDFFATVDATPDWVDPHRLAAGARACQISGLTGTHVLRDVALMGGYQAGGINKTLVLTGQLERGAQPRVAQTYRWWLDCTREGGMARFAPGFAGTLRVRLVHALMRDQLRQRPDWQLDDWGLPVNQVDMQATYLGFSVIFLFAQRLMGVPLRRQEAEDVMHLWRYIAWLMGVSEQWLVTSEQEGRVALYRNLLTQAPADRSSVELGRALMDEPLDRHYPVLGALRGRYDRAKHLSICRFFLGRRGMRSLGLPSWMPPWYPLLTLPVRGAWHGAHRLRPGGRAYLIRSGGRAQVEYLKILFGESEPDSPATQVA